jgi:DNA-binding MarR family transcriptional regulator
VPNTPDLLFLLHDVARLLRYEADRRAGAHGMTRAQWIILFWLERQPGLSQKELAEILEVEPITVARLIDRLEGRNMVERRPDVRDRRIWRLHLLPDASQVLEELHEERADMHRMLTAGVDAATQQAMIDGLGRMKATLLTECRHKGICKDQPAADVAMKDTSVIFSKDKESV